MVLLGLTNPIDLMIIIVLKNRFFFPLSHPSTDFKGNQNMCRIVRPAGNAAKNPLEQSLPEFYFF